MEYVVNVVSKMKKILVIILMLFLITGCNKNSQEYTIVATNFPSYDFSRAITKDSNIKVEMLLKPGSEIHDFEPTPQDILKIKNSKIFIYVGGESDAWIDDILIDIDPTKTKIVKLMDLVDTYEEEITEGMEEETEESDETELDEHVWTSPVNAIKITKKLTDYVISIDESNKELYESNRDSYIKELENIDTEIREVVSNAKRKELVFGDRFPFRYFVEEYGLTYYAAFPGCSEASEASAKTISFLINKVKEDKIPVIFHIELSNNKIAETISKETGAKVLELNSAHNISKTEFDECIRYVDIMKNNIVALKEALN